MKSSFLAALFFVILMTESYSQTPINVCEDCDNLLHIFDFNSVNDSSSYFIYIDTLQSNNIWQVGHPQKAFFDSGLAGPRALVTDTLNPYPPNTLSSFQYSIINCSQETSGGCGGYVACFITVSYKINSDSLIDGGTIEVSHNGDPYINIINDPLANIAGIYSVYDTISSLNKPGFSGSTSNWQEFGISYEPLSQSSDTITFRFTFSSDSIQTNKDGWMIGMIQIGGLFEGIPKIYKKGILQIYPNPCSDHLALKVLSEYENGQLIIYSQTGQFIEKIYNVVNDELINTANLPEGVYFIQYSKDRNFTIERFIKKN